jgi:hypothetical protein
MALSFRSLLPEKITQCIFWLQQENLQTYKPTNLQENLQQENPNIPSKAPPPKIAPVTNFKMNLRL